MDTKFKVNHLEDEKRGQPHIIFLDEMTMTSKEIIEKVIERFPYSWIVLAGDFNDDFEPYQCVFSNGYFDNEHRLFKPVYFTEDRRSKCDELKLLKLQIRDAIDGKAELPELKASLKLNDLKTHYNHKNDFIICYTNKMAETITELMPEYQSFMITKPHKFRETYYNTGEVVKDIEPTFSKKRLAFTTHSFQGKTIEEPSRLFIVLEDGLFRDLKVLYTAISRVRTLKQIICVIPE
jgi:hypothetical protein